MSTLFLVATPIGNLDDISARALKVLREVSLIAVEDTRRAKKLLSRYDIHTPIDSYFEYNKLVKLPAVLAKLSEGDVALISDAGTPGLNDPGFELVRAAIAAGHTVSPIPGPCAPVAALVASGLPADKFLYLGYLPRRHQERKRLLQEIKDLPYTLVFLEVPHRILASLVDLKEILGDRPAGIGREITKLHEEFFRGALSQALAHFNAQPPRGEFTLVIAGNQPQPERWSVSELKAYLENRLSEGATPSDAASQAASLSGWRRREIYAFFTAQKSGASKNKQELTKASNA